MDANHLISLFYISILLLPTFGQLILQVDHAGKTELDDPKSPFKEVAVKPIKHHPRVLLTYYTRQNADRPIIPPLLNPEHFQKLLLMFLVNIASEENFLNRMREKEDKIHNPFDFFANLRRNYNMKSKHELKLNLQPPQEICDICKEYCSEKSHGRDGDKNSSEPKKEGIKKSEPDTKKSEPDTKKSESLDDIIKKVLDPASVNKHRDENEGIHSILIRSSHTDNHSHKAKNDNLEELTEKTIDLPGSEVNISAKINELESHHHHPRSTEEGNSSKLLLENLNMTSAVPEHANFTLLNDMLNNSMAFENSSEEQSETITISGETIDNTTSNKDTENFKENSSLPNITLNDGENHHNSKRSANISFSSNSINVINLIFSGKQGENNEHIHKKTTTGSAGKALIDSKGKTRLKHSEDVNKKYEDTVPTQEETTEKDIILITSESSSTKSTDNLENKTILPSTPRTTDEKDKRSLKEMSDKLSEKIMKPRKGKPVNRRRRNMKDEIDKWNETVNKKSEQQNILNSIRDRKMDDSRVALEIDEYNAGFNELTDKNNDKFLPKLNEPENDIGKLEKLLQPILFEPKRDISLNEEEMTTKIRVERERNRSQSLMVTLPTVICIGAACFVLYFIVRSCYSLVKQRPAFPVSQTGSQQSPYFQQK